MHQLKDQLQLDSLMGPVVAGSTDGTIKGVVNCQNSRDKGPPESNSARG